MSDFEIRLLHTLVCAPPFDLLIFYIFRDRLRFARSHVIIGYVLLLALTQLIQMSSVQSMTLTALLCRPLAIIYMMAVIRDSPLRVFSITLLVYPLLMLASTLGAAAEQFFGEGLPLGLWKCLLVPMMFLLVLPAALHTMRHLLTPMLHKDDRRLWIYLCGYEVILVALAVTADPSGTSVQPTIIAARLLLPLALVQYPHALYGGGQRTSREADARTDDPPIRGGTLSYDARALAQLTPYAPRPQPPHDGDRAARTRGQP